jgi:ATP-dependent helicase/nuclease subunit A
MNSPVTTTPQQHRAALPHASVWVNANAGSGKTYVLVNRIARLLLAGADPASIICLTYTNAAANEMEARVHRLLGSWTFKDDKELGAELRKLGVAHVDARLRSRARRLFSLTQETPGGFRIQTIHAFCEKILQLFPVEAGVSPGFRILEEERKKLLLRQARERVLAGAATDAASPLAAAMATITRYAKADDLDSLIDRLIGTFGGGLDPESCAAALRTAFGLDQSHSSDGFAEAIANGDAALMAKAIDALGAAGGSNNMSLAASLRQLMTASAAGRLQAAKDCYLDSKCNPKAFGNLGWKKLRSGHPWFEAYITGERDRICGILEQHDALLRVEATVALVSLAREIVSVFEDLKSAQSLHSFDDLIDNTHLLLNQTQAADWILYKLDRGVEHILIDEAQDTSPPQWGIVEALSREFFAGLGARDGQPRTLFVVGDPKQSIFSFQGADTRAFSHVHGLFGQSVGHSGQSEPFDVDLTVSYRSTETVLSAVDAIFAKGMPARKGLAIDGEEGLLHHTNRMREQGIFEIWPPVTAENEDMPDPWTPPTRAMKKLSHRRLLARKIALTVKSWIGTRMLPSQGRTVQPEDILILFRRRKALFYMLINELRAAGIPVAGADRLKPNENLAVLDMLALITALSQPLDDYALACVLKSPLVATPLSEQQLFTLAHDRGAATLWERLTHASDEACRAIHAELAHWRAAMASLRPYEFLSAILLARRPAILGRLGSEASDAVDAMVEAAIAYEADHPPSITGFANWFQSEDMTVKRDMDQGRNEVRLMTAHGAKGLESRIVILADSAEAPDANRSNGLLAIEPEAGGEPLPLWDLPKLFQSPHVTKWKSVAKDSTHEEYCRLLYVAMTRACDELYVSGSCGKGEIGGTSWYGMAQAALNIGDGAIAMRDATMPDGGACLRFGSDPIWSEAASPAQTASRDLPSWLLAPPRLAPRTHRAAPSSLARPPRAASPQAAARGTFIHTLLQSLPELPPDHRARHIERHVGKGRLSAADGRGLSAILAMSELFGPDSRAEVAVAGQGLQGVIDRLVVGPDTVLIVDYKSGQRPPAGLPPDHPYALQLAAYARLLAALHPGKEITAGLLWTDEVQLDWLPPETLQKAIAIAGQRLQQSVT